MARSATSIASLGPGRFDGEEGTILLGIDDAVALTWRQDTVKWRSEETLLFELHSVAMSHFGPGNQWKYLFVPAGNPGQFNRSDFGFSPAPIRNAAAAYAAGLVLEECTPAAVFHSTNGNGFLGNVLYPFNDGDGISGTIDPDPYVSTQLEATGTRTWTASDGWQESAFDADLIDGAAILAPHLYTQYTSGGDALNLRQLLGLWRWAGTPA